VYVCAAKIVKPGAVAETLHTDQWWLPPPQIRERGPGAAESQPEVRTGSITRELAYTAAMHSGDNVVTMEGSEGEQRAVSFIPPCAANQALFLCSDFTEENGATLLVPGSHLAGRHPTKKEAQEGGKAAGAVSLCAPAGTCIVFDSRCWHMSGGFEGVDEDADGEAASGPDDPRDNRVTVGQSLKELRPADDNGWVEPHTGKPWRLGVFMNYVGPMIRQVSKILRYLEWLAKICLCVCVRPADCAALRCHWIIAERELCSVDGPGRAGEAER
jgi:hypothetical protein